MMAFPAETARMLGSSEHLLPMVTDYLLWFVPSWVFQIWITVSLFVIRLDGSPKLAMLCSLITAVINVVLDWLFIFPFGWGVMGAAFATSISIMAGGLVAMVYLLFYARHLRLQPLKWSVKSLRLSVRNIGYQCRIGPSALLGEATLAVLMFVGNQVFMSYLGDDGVGAFGIACYYIPFVFMVGNAIAQSAQPIISYNYGAGKPDRVRRAFWLLLRCAMIYAGVLWATTMLFPQLYIGVFTPDQELIAYAIPAVRIYMAASLLFGIQLSCQQTFVALGNAKNSLFLAVLRKLILLIPLIYLLPALLPDKVTAVFLAEPVADTIAVTVTVLLFRVKFTACMREMEERAASQHA